jgi:hypothetical protein
LNVLAPILRCFSKKRVEPQTYNKEGTSHRYQKSPK